MNKVNTSYKNLLMQFRRSWQAGMGLVSLLKACRLFTGILIIYALLDVLLAFPQDFRLASIIVIVLFASGLFLSNFTRVFSLTDKDVARLADKRLKSKREEILTALELCSQLDGQDKDQDKDRDNNQDNNQDNDQDDQDNQGLRKYLIGQCSEKAARLLKKADYRQKFPITRIEKGFKQAGIIIMLGVFLVCIDFSAGITLLGRIFMPLKDIPPVSPYEFEIFPPSPVVQYGGTREIGVEISGHPVQDQVWLVTRRGRDIHQTPCFQVSDSRFAQRLEKIVYPVEFCFRTGRARSKWQKVELLLQPKISSVSAAITPPAYTGLPAREIDMAAEMLAGLKGSEVRLSVTSNRPLSGGRLRVNSRQMPDRTSVFKGDLQDSRTVMFRWNIEEKADLDISVFDMRGIPNKDEYVLEQHILDDALPEISIEAPLSFVKATPESVLPLHISARDDIGLKYVELVRTVRGYRDRVKTLGPSSPASDFNFEENLDLKKLGVLPDQVIELFAEAMDHNPTLLGISATSVVKIQVESTAAYARMLRAKEGIEQFIRRYRVISGELSGLVNQTRELKNMLAGGSSQPALVDEILEKMRVQNDRTRRLFKKLANDLPIYEMETLVIPLLRQMTKMLDQNRKILTSTGSGDPGLARKIDEILKNLSASEDDLKPYMAEAEEIAKIARVMECAVRFQRLYERQQVLVRRIRFYADQSDRSNTGRLRIFEKEQNRVLDDLKKLMDDMDKRAYALPKKYRELTRSTVGFADKIFDYGIERLMGESAQAAKQLNTGLALEKASLALEKMENLLSDCRETSFGKIGRNPGAFLFESGFGHGFKDTLNQFMEGFMMGPGSGGADGFSMGAYSPLNVPFYGPSRTSFQDEGVSGTGPVNGKNVQGPLKPDVMEKMDVTERLKPGQLNVLIENAPEKYQKALKKYFSSGENQ